MSQHHNVFTQPCGCTETRWGLPTRRLSVCPLHTMPLNSPPQRHVIPRSGTQWVTVDCPSHVANTVACAKPVMVKVRVETVQEEDGIVTDYNLEDMVNKCEHEYVHAWELEALYESTRHAVLEGEDK